jgi:hypothetical protein
MLTEQEKLQKIREIIQTYDNKRGHDRCWYYPDLFEEIAKVVDVSLNNHPILPDRATFEEGCKKYQDQQFNLLADAKPEEEESIEQFPPEEIIDLQHPNVFIHKNPYRLEYPYVVWFKVDNQYFEIRQRETEEQARWVAQMLINAVNKLYVR